MKAKVVLFFFLSLSIQLSAQKKWALISEIEREDYYLLKGTIDGKYPITMYLKKDFNYCRNEDLERARVLKGWYQYDRYKTKIPLIGYQAYWKSQQPFYKLFVTSNYLEDVSMTNCEVADYQECFLVQECCSLSEMQWFSKSNDHALAVQLEEIHSLSWETTAKIKLTIRGLELLEINLSELTKNEYIDVIQFKAVKEIDGSFYAIINFGHLTTPGHFGSGQCGSGWEDYMGFLKIGADLQVEQFYFHLNQSCYRVVKDKYAFDVEHPEKGLWIK